MGNFSLIVDEKIRKITKKKSPPKRLLQASPRKKIKTQLRKVSYVEMNEKRRKFRDAIVNVIGSPSTDETISTWITEEENDIFKYYCYILHGIDEEHVAPMQDQWMSDIGQLIPDKWKSKFTGRMTELVEEIKNDYCISIKKALVDFVLEDPLNNNIGLNGKVAN